MFRILLVCTGNTCRSPMAQILLQFQIDSAGLRDQYLADSAGTGAWPGQAASAEAIAVMHEQGLSLAGHRSRKVTGEMVESADLILALSHSHLQTLRQRFAAQAQKIHLLGDYGGNGEDVADPIGTGLSEYRECAGQIGKLVEQSWEKILTAGRKI